MRTRPARQLARHTAAALAATAAAAACLLTVAGPVAAQDNNGQGQGEPGENAQTWSVQPAGEDGADGRASFDYTAEPAGSITDHAQVNNFSTQPLTLRVYSQDAVNTPTGGYTLLPGDQPPADVGAWIGLDQTVTVPAGDTVVVPFTLTVPDNATPGDHPGGIVTSLTTNATDEQGNPVLVDHRVGARVHLRVNGQLNPALAVSDLHAGYHRTLAPLASGTLTLTYTVTNTGNVRLAGDQQLAVRGLFGLDTRTVPLPDLPEILPGQSITTTTEISAMPLLRLSGDLHIQPQPPPHYTNDPPAAPASAQTTTWAIPWPELALLALLGSAVWGSLWRRRRRNRREAARLAAAVATAREQALQENLPRRTAPTPDPRLDVRYR